MNYFYLFVFPACFIFLFSDHFRYVYIYIYIYHKPDFNRIAKGLRSKKIAFPGSESKLYMIPIIAICTFLTTAHMIDKGIVCTSRSAIGLPGLLIPTHFQSLSFSQRQSLPEWGALRLVHNTNIWCPFNYITTDE